MSSEPTSSIVARWLGDEYKLARNRIGQLHKKLRSNLSQDCDFGADIMENYIYQEGFKGVMALDWEEIEAAGKTYLLNKSELIAETARKEGNEFYRLRKFSEAMTRYSLATCFARPNSKELILAYSNRSACLMEMTEPSESIKDIETCVELLKQVSIPDEEKDKISLKLKQRKQRCLDLVPKNSFNNGSCSKAHSIFQMCCENPRISSAENVVNIVETEEMGRHVVVEKDTPPGTLLILEKPYSKILLKKFSWDLEHCHLCFRKLLGGTVSCPECVFAIYCSKSCLDSARKTHQDCTGATWYHYLNLSRIVLLAFQTLLTLGSEKLAHFVKTNLDAQSDQQAKEQDNHIKGFDDQNRYVSSFQTVYDLIYHPKNLPREDVHFDSSMALFLTEILDQTSNFFSKYDTHARLRMKQASAKILFRLQMNLPCNAHSVHQFHLPNTSSRTIAEATAPEIGAGAFSLLSLLNHSCDPNCTRVTLKDGETALISMSSLKKGQQLFDNYGYHYALCPTSERRRQLREYYHFYCNCIACTQDWPLYEVINATPAQFVCPTCTSHLTPYEKTEASNSQFKLKNKTPQCPNCSKSFPGLVDLYNSHKQPIKLLLNNKPEESMSEVISVIKTLETFVLYPTFAFNIAQETLKQALNCLSIKTE